MAPVKFEVGVGFASRCHAWKGQVWPAIAGTEPAGDAHAAMALEDGIFAISRRPVK